MVYESALRRSRLNTFKLRRGGRDEGAKEVKEQKERVEEDHD